MIPEYSMNGCRQSAFYMPTCHNPVTDKVMVINEQTIMTYSLETLLNLRYLLLDVTSKIRLMGILMYPFSQEGSLA